MITAAELLAASKPLRRITSDEARAALKALGIDEDRQKCCISCSTWKAHDEFVQRGTYKGKHYYSSECKTCLREPTDPFKRRPTRGMTHKTCPLCNIEKPIDRFPKDGLYKDGEQRHHSHCTQCKNLRRR